ncbi:PIG-L deacetylase family protein [Komagataeibacter sp. FNDCF1]|uniref:PIG-L deacetylase family protein n=1 Tax=Komagataeibacter sp. FNDCF1 TaxID=2878681 RepID=UPI001E611D09|nr:PIG-L family deacetylase [Komagataeibacter sp. FNDCF1]MCE2563562.1 PIG-L family deacetylase [Komagataeibacter sp. FNDCF1]
MKAACLHDALRALPVAPLSAVAGGTVMVLAPHPDDESLGCGGLVAACCAAGNPPLVVIVTDGTASHPNSRAWPAARLRMQRQREALDATGSLGLPAGRVVFLDLPDAAAPHHGPDFDHAVARLAALATDYGCTAVFAPWRLDPHCDHEATWKMGMALRQRCGLVLWAYPVWGWLIPADRELDHGPPVGLRLDISRYRAAKARAVGLHASQYGGLITDAPDGFSLPAELLAVIITDFEVFIRS